MGAMDYLIVIGLFVVIAVMSFGGYSMARGGKYDDSHAFELMEARVIVQAITIGLILIALFFW